MVERHTEMANLHPDVIARLREIGIFPVISRPSPVIIDSQEYPTVFGTPRLEAVTDGLVSLWAVLTEEDILSGRWFDNTPENSQVSNGEPAYGDVGGKPFDQAMAEWDALIKEARESE